AALGFKNVILVEKQTNPDGNFPTVIYPNPEESEAMSLALAKAREVEADLVMATDPDADRVGIAVKNQHGDFQLLNGNQTGSLIIYYLLTQWSALNKIKGKEFVVKTIVTTTLIRRLAEKFKVKCYDTLTGFKYIATLIRELEGKEKFIGGGEESYGYLIGDTVRDKDAVASCAIIAEMTAYAKNKGKSLFELLVELYIQHGFYYESLFSITKKGQKGAEEIQEMMNTFRTTPPSTLAGSTVIKSIDYKTGVETNMENGQTTKLPFLSSNVLQFVTSDDTIVSARPSGTEPKIKFYFSVKSPLNHESDYENTRQQLVKKIEMIKKELKLIP
ncbi:MAG: phospho-sugar mutase, partial [Cyclobacteriaceae bacterium]|nr:phospho-sugar mutase [Cyclobacteriaceae bacterium]